MELTFPITTPVFYSANLGTDEPIRPLGTYQRGTTVLFVDRDTTPEQVKGWDHVIRTDYRLYGETPRKAARWLKLQSHKLFPQSPWTIWFDATNDPAVDLLDLVTMYGNSHTTDIACFRHPARDSAKEEARVCRDLKLDTDKAIDGILEWMARVGYPDANGLYVTSCLVRRNTPQIAALNELWTWAVTRWSQRDQISFPWALWAAGVTPACLRGAPRDDTAASGVETFPNPYFRVTVWD